MIDITQDGNVQTITVNPFSSFQFRVKVDWERRDLKIELAHDMQGGTQWSLVYRIDNGIAG